VSSREAFVPATYYPSGTIIRRSHEIPENVQSLWSGMNEENVSGPEFIIVKAPTHEITSLLMEVCST